MTKCKITSIPEHARFRKFYDKLFNIFSDEFINQSKINPNTVLNKKNFLEMMQFVSKVLQKRANIVHDQYSDMLGMVGKCLGLYLDFNKSILINSMTKSHYVTLIKSINHIFNQLPKNMNNDQELTITTHVRYPIGYLYHPLTNILHLLTQDKYNDVIHEYFVHKFHLRIIDQCKSVLDLIQDVNEIHRACFEQLPILYEKYYTLDKNIFFGYYKDVFIFVFMV